MKKINEEELRDIFKRIKNNESDAMDLLYEKYNKLVYGVAFSILKNKENSEDVTQEVFSKLLKLDKNLLPDHGEASWLYTVTKNETIQFLRKYKATLDIDELYTLESESDQIDDIVDMESYYKLIENLSKLDQEIISLRILSDFTFEKIAQMLDMSLGTVQWRYYKALHSIKLSLGNLTAFLVAFSTWNMINKWSFSLNSAADVSENRLDENRQDNRTGNQTGHSGGFDTTFNCHDSSGASGSIAEVARTLLFLGFMCICLVFVVLSVFFAIRKKVKIKRKK